MNSKEYLKALAKHFENILNCSNPKKMFEFKIENKTHFSEPPDKK